MADNDLTILILRNIQAELVAHRERFDAIDKRFAISDERFAISDERFATSQRNFATIQDNFATIQGNFATIQSNFVAVQNKLSGLANSVQSMNERIDTLRDEMVQQFAHLDLRLSSVENIATRTAATLDSEMQASRSRTTRTEGDIAELKIRVTALELIAKAKPPL